eukprot:3340166-Pleurochrysis_carterae.AAC.1
MKNAKFDVVWQSCETPNLLTIFDLSPNMADVADAAGDDYQVRTLYVLCVSCRVSSNEDDIALV